jgi:hypothetical protein
MKLYFSPLILFALAGCNTSAETERANKDVVYAEKGKTEIAKLLRDPSSAEFDEVRVSRKQAAPVVCGKVNSRNGFGGMTGNKRFIAAPGVIGVVEGENTTQAEFSGSWIQFCS